MDNPVADIGATAFLVDGQSGNTDLEQVIVVTFIEAYRLWQDRQRKYGVGNIGKFGEVGCVVRLSDKLERLIQLVIRHKGGDSADEDPTDTWLDAVNYAVMGLVNHRGQWPNG